MTIDYFGTNHNRGIAPRQKVSLRLLSGQNYLRIMECLGIVALRVFESLKATDQEVQMQYEDFRQAGLILIGPSSPDHELVVSQIKARRLQIDAQTDPFGIRTFVEKLRFPEDPRRSVVFFNKSEKSVFLAQVLWRFEMADGRKIVSSCAWLGAEMLVLPFGLTSDTQPKIKYISAILPGSKRYITNAGEVLGDNTDVRPHAEEIWKGGLVIGVGRILRA